MGLLKDTIKNQVKSKDILQNYSGATARIESYNEVTNRASIYYTDPNSGIERHVSNVPVNIGMAGFRGASIRPGMKCSITFLNGSPFSPVITGILTNMYSDMNITNNGGCIVNQSIMEATLPNDFIPLCESWIDENNYNPNKYAGSSDSEVDYNIDCNTSAYEIFRKISHMSGQEQGVTNLINGSTIRVKENGDIELFVSNNVGIRISNEDQKIYLYGLVVETNSQS